MMSSEINAYRNQPWYYQHLSRSVRRGKTISELHALRREKYLLLHPSILTSNQIVEVENG
jgi:hypothetical protein